MKIQEAKENIIKNWRANYTTGEVVRFEILNELNKLRDKISYQYYEISIPMDSVQILRKLDKIIKKLKQL